MARTKTPQEIADMREGGQLLSRALGAAVEAVGVGVRLKDIDAIGERVIREGGGEPAFKGYKIHSEDTPFPSTICLSLNEEVVHGLGNRDIELKEGDVLGLDIGSWYKGLCTDMAVTVPVGAVSKDVEQLLHVTREALMQGVSAARVGGDIKDISRAVEAHAKPYGYGIVRALVGHGVGHEVHEEPQVPNVVSPEFPSVTIQDGMCLAIEPMLGSGGDPNVETAEDGWSIRMVDKSIAAHFEVTIAITNEGTEILTPLPV